MGPRWIWMWCVTLLWGRPEPYIYRVGQNRVYAPFMTVYLVISLPKMPYIHRICMVLANLTYTVHSVHTISGLEITKYTVHIYVHTYIYGAHIRTYTVLANFTLLCSLHWGLLLRSCVGACYCVACVGACSCVACVGACYCVACVGACSCGHDNLASAMH